MLTVGGGVLEMQNRSDVSEQPNKSKVENFISVNKKALILLYVNQIMA